MKKLTLIKIARFIVMNTVAITIHLILGSEHLGVVLLSILGMFVSYLKGFIHGVVEKG